jgi:DNA polymerase-3 subunit epsilon
MDFIAIDFETANATRCSVCAVGVALVKDGKISKVGSWLIRPPELYFSPFNISIHGITENQVRKKPEFNKFWPKLWPVIKGKPVIAHNASFDMSVIRHTFDFYGKNYPSFNYFCTIAIAKSIWPGLMNYKLPTVSEHLNISFNHHDPAEDAVAAARIAIKALKKSHCKNLFQLSEDIGIHPGKLFPGGYRPCRQA